MADRDKIRNFLLQVANDATLRQQLETDALSALTAAGFTVSQQDVPQSITLPANDAILSQIDQLTDHIEGVMWNYF